MALRWDWKEKCGELIIEQDGKEYSVTLFEGNAYLIFISQYQEDGKDMYALYNFWADKVHAKRCLGLVKGYENIYQDGRQKWKRVRLNKAKCKNYAEIVGFIAKAFDDIEIEIYKEV